MAALIEFAQNADLKIKTSDQARVYCESAGQRFIRLRFKAGVGCLVRGFQPVRLVIRRATRDNAPAVEVIPKLTSDGKVFKDGSADFTPDALGVCWAEVAATEHNMKVLAGHEINDSALWVIADQRDRKEIQDLAVELAPKYGWTTKKAEPHVAKPFRELPAAEQQEQKPVVVEMPPKNEVKVATLGFTPKPEFVRKRPNMHLNTAKTQYMNTEKVDDATEYAEPGDVDQG